MNCERFQSVAGGLARNEILEASERASALAHVEECTRCGQTWSDQRELSDGLRIVAQQMNSLQAPAHLEEKLRAALQERNRVRPIKSAPQRWRYWVGAAAAVLLIVFGVMAWRARVASLPQRPFEASSSGGSSQSKPEKPEQSNLGVSQQNQSAIEPAPKERKSSSKPRKFRQARRDDGITLAKLPTVESESTQTANNETREITTDFVALGYGSAMDLQDGGQLVRVELPRSALARFGLPMNMDRADERVKADLLVAADGLARAIRFVK